MAWRAIREELPQILSKQRCGLVAPGRFRLKALRGDPREPARGVWRGFAGRELDVKLAGGRKQFAESPDGCSVMATAKLV